MDYVGQFSGEEIDARLRLVTEKMDKAKVFEITYDRYLIIPWENSAVLAIMTEAEGITSQPFFVALGGGECKITTIDKDGLAVEFFLGTIDSASQLALYNISGDEEISVKAHVLLLAGEMPEMIIGQDSDFDATPEVFRDVNSFARHIELSARLDEDMNVILGVNTNVVRDNPTADIVLIYYRDGLCFDRITYVELDQNGDLNTIKTASGRQVEI